MRKAYLDIGLHGNNVMESLSANIAEDSYYEITRSGNLVSNETWWTTPAKTQKIREIIYTRSGNLVTQSESRQYNSAGILVSTFTQDFARSGNLLSNVTGARS